MNVLIIDCSDGTTTVQELTAKEEAEFVDRAVPVPDQPDPATVVADPIDAFAAKLRAELPAATTLTKLRAVLSDALDELG